jgi:GAF domain-containing protein
MAQHRSDIAAALAAAAEAINAPHDLDETLGAIVRAARASVPGFDHVGISVRHQDGRFETKAATGELVRALDRLQCELDEGPCVDAMKAQEVVVAEHLPEDHRWPRYRPEAVALGVRSQLGVQLYADDRTLGGLNFYSSQSETVDPEAEIGAYLFATHAAQALGHAHRESQLAKAVESRTVIGQSIGLLMERYQIDRERAFQFLVRASSTSNTKLRDVARQVADAAEARYSHTRT